jgi:hypothetical protein
MTYEIVYRFGYDVLYRPAGADNHQQIASGLPTLDEAIKQIAFHSGQKVVITVGTIG